MKVDACFRQSLILFTAPNGLNGHSSCDILLINQRASKDRQFGFPRVTQMGDFCNLD